ncbi:phosphoketolase family protein [Chitinimonas sp. PSY-7]|uniref:phosphoketolase n=1 Tax=Chitinimonas sp. PSY-7 TaxID=3459088 RepID=UPI00404027DB
MIAMTQISTGLSADQLQQINSFWRACNYLAAGMIYLRANPLLQQPLIPEHIKERLLGHWGTSPGLSFIWTHLSRVVARDDLNAIFLAGPGHGAPGVLAPCWLEGRYGEIYRDKGQSIQGMQRFFTEFSFPGGIGSHCTPELPGSIHEGGELGYSLSHAFGAAFDNPDLLVTVVVGDGESETGPLATAWHSNKFLNPARDGAVLPVLHLNGYKINNPTVLSRIPETELLNLFQGYGWRPVLVEGDDPNLMHQRMAAVMDECVALIRHIQTSARTGKTTERPCWPMIILRSPKGWTGPAEVDGHVIAGTWRAHQVPLTSVRENAAHLQQLASWLLSYAPATLFEPDGRPRQEIISWLPKGERRLSANPHANGGQLRIPLQLPNWTDYAVDPIQEGHTLEGNTEPLGGLLRDVIRMNPSNFRLFGPDETASNKLQATFSEGKVWMSETLATDEDGGALSPIGRVMEYLSEHTLEGWLEGYLLTGRHGLLSTYEAFSHVIDSMFNQHAKWLDIADKVHWRTPISSLNLLITSTVWRQDHNGFSHQDPGFLDVVVNKSPKVTRIYLPPDANCLLAVTDHCLRSTNYINVIVADKQKHLQYLDAQAAALHCARGLGIWRWASNDESSEPDLVMAACGDVPTQESLAATHMLRTYFPALKIRFINVVDLFRLQPNSEHPHGLSDADFDSLFTRDKPIIFNFHGYPWLIHRLTYRRANHSNLHVRGYKEKGNIDTPLELAIRNEIDRFSLVIDAINRVPKLNVIGAAIKQMMRDRQATCRAYAFEHGVDLPEEADWRWSEVVSTSQHTT